VVAAFLEVTSGLVLLMLIVLAGRVLRTGAGRRARPEPLAPRGEVLQLDLTRARSAYVPSRHEISSFKLSRPQLCSRRKAKGRPANWQGSKFVRPLSWARRSEEEREIVDYRQDVLRVR
jgi:hypothetical protein